MKHPDDFSEDSFLSLALPKLRGLSSTELEGSEKDEESTEDNELEVVKLDDRCSGVFNNMPIIFDKDNDTYRPEDFQTNAELKSKLVLLEGGTPS